MTLILKLIGAFVLAGVLLVGGFVADLVWNDSRLFYAVAGRDGLVGACTPLTVEDLTGRGFSPTDLAFSPRPAIGMTMGPDGRVRTLSSDITFSDGPNGQRIDGRVVCTVAGKGVTVRVDVDSLPRRVT